MLEILIFVIGQLLINLIIRLLNKGKVTYIFCSISTILFAWLMLIYPNWSWRIDNFFYPPEPNQIRCGNVWLGVAMFQWFVGMPLVVVLQSIFNKRIHRMNLLKEKYREQKEKFLERYKFFWGG